MGTPVKFLRGSAVPRLVAWESEGQGRAQKPEQQSGAAGRGICFSLYHRVRSLLPFSISPCRGCKTPCMQRTAKGITSLTLPPASQGKGGTASAGCSAVPLARSTLRFL